MLVDIQHTCSLRILSCTVEDMQFNYESSLSKPILAVSRLIFGVCPLDTTKYNPNKDMFSRFWILMTKQKNLHRNTVKMAYLTMLKQV